MNQPRVNANVVMKLMFSEAEKLLINHGEDKATSARCAQACVERIIAAVGGGQFYFPKWTNEQARTKNAEIKNELLNSRESIRAIASRHGITEVTAYKILKETYNVVPSQRTSSHDVVEAFAIEAAKMLMKIGISPGDAVLAARGYTAVLIAHFGGRTIYLPSVKSIEAQRLEKQIVAMHLSGMSAKQIGVRLNITDAWVGQVIKRHCAATGESSPKHKRYMESILQTKRRVLELADSYRATNSDSSTLFRQAAALIEEAHGKLKVVMRTGDVRQSIQ